MSDQRDLELLRRFEPIVRYTKGECFFPMAVDGYIAECDLWAGSPRGGATLLAGRGTVTVDTLAAWHARVPGQSLFLRFVQEPLWESSSPGATARGGRPSRPPAAWPGSASWPA